MEERGKNDFSDVAVENAIQDLKKIRVKQFDNQSLAKLSPVDQRNNNNNNANNDFAAEERNNNDEKFDDNGNLENGPKSTMRMAVTGNEAMTASCSESESEDPLELIERLSANGSGDEGTWLYQSPGARISSSHLTPIRNGRLNESGAGDGPDSSKRRSKASPLDWLRRDFDQTPSPEVEKARHSLVNKVDEITQGRLDTQTFRIRDSRNQARKSLQELINVSGPHQATSTQTSSHECQTEEQGMQTSFLDETQSEPSSAFVRSPRYRTFTRKNVVPARLRLGRDKRDCPPLNELPQHPPLSGSSSPRMINAGFDKLSAVEIDIDADAHSDPAPEQNGNDAVINLGTPPEGGNSSQVQNGVVGKRDVTNLVPDSKSRTFTRPKKAARAAIEPARESKEAVGDKVPGGGGVVGGDDDDDILGGVDASSTEEGGGEERAEFPHLPTRGHVDSSTFTRPMKKNVKSKKLNRPPLHLPAKKGKEEEVVVGEEREGEFKRNVPMNEGTTTTTTTRGGKEEEHLLRLGGLTDEGEFEDDEDDPANSFDNNKPKILGTATITRKAGRRLQPKLRLNGAPDEEVAATDDGDDARSSSPRSSLPSAEESPRQLRKSSTESRPDSRSESRSSPVVWDQSNFDKPADMVDVQVMARMQEDSLRRSIVVNRGAEKPKLTGIVQPLTSQNGHARGEVSSTLPSPFSKHGGGGNSRRIGNGATTAEEGNSTKPRIGREDSASSMHSMDSNPGIGGVGGRSGSDSLSAHSGTPPDSPLGGSRSDLQSTSSPRGGVAGRRRGGAGGVQPPSSVTRRSLPNLAAQSGLAPPKAKPAQLSSIRNPQPSLKSHTSDSNLRDKSGLRQPTPTSRLKPPTSGLRAASPASAATSGAGNRSISPGGIPRGIVSPTPRAVPAKNGSSIGRPARGGASSNKTAGVPRNGATQPTQPRRSGIQVRASPRTAAPEWEEDYY